MSSIEWNSQREQRVGKRRERNSQWGMLRLLLACLWTSTSEARCCSEAAKHAVNADIVAEGGHVADALGLTAPIYGALIVFAVIAVLYFYFLITARRIEPSGLA